MKKILLIAFSKVKYAPYIDFYLHALDSKGCQVHLLYWDRDGEEENLSHMEGITRHEFRAKQEDDVPKHRKIRNFLRFRRFAKNLLRTEHFDALIVLTSLPAVLLSDLLTRRYAGRYIFDYRDVTYEHLPFYRRRIHQVARHAAGIFISSEGFRDYLPPDTADKTYLTHNLRPEDLRHRDTEKRPSGVIRLAFWGCLRDELLNRRLVDVLSSDFRFELHYYGREQRTSRSLKQCVRKCGAENVFFHGEYEPKDRYTFASETDLLHNMFSNDTMRPAVSNRYYDGALFRIPQLCFAGSRMGELCEAAGVGMVADPFAEDFPDRIYDWYTHLDRNAFERACDREISQAAREYESAQQAVRQLVDACGKQKVCFLLGGFQNCGGIERVVTTLANGLCEGGRCEVHAIAFLEEANREPFFPLSADVKRHRLFDRHCSMREALLQGHAIRKVRRILRQEGIDTLVACGTLYFPLACLAARGLSVHCLCWEHTDPMATDDHLFQMACRKFGIRFADRLIVLTDRAKNTYVETLHAKADKMVRIYNPVAEPMSEKPYQPDAKRIISAGRLSTVKDYALLLDVAAEVLKTHTDWTWDIYGEGEERPLLEEKIHRLGLAGQVRLMGAVRDIQDRYTGYALLVQTSRYEGFGLALAEAAAAGLPCVAFDVPSGPGEIIAHGETGLLVPAGERVSMIQAVTKLMDSPALRQQMSDRAKAKAKRFHPTPILRQWETLLGVAEPTQGMKLLMVTGGLPPYEDANSAILYRLAKVLSERYGVEISVLGYQNGPTVDDRRYRTWIMPERHRYLQTVPMELPPVKKLLRLVTHPRALLFRLRFQRDRYPLQRYYQKHLKRILRQKRFDAILCGLCPYDTLAGAVEVVTDTPLLAYKMDPWGTHETLRTDRRHWQTEQKADACCAAIFTTLPIYADYAAGRNLAPLEKVHPLEFPNLMPPKGEAIRYFNDCKIHCLYAGQLYEDIRSPDFLFELFRKLEGDPVELHILGNTPQQAAAYAPTLPQNVQFHGIVPPTEAAAWMESADVLVNLGNAVSNQLPSKLITYLACGKPILNLCKRPDCLTLPYMARYPLACTLMEPAGVTAEAVERVQTFLRTYSKARLPFDEVAALYPACTPESVAEQVYEVLRQAADSAVR